MKPGLPQVDGVEQLQDLHLLSHLCLPAVEGDHEPGSGRAGSHAHCPLGMWTEPDWALLYSAASGLGSVVGHGGLRATLGLLSLEKPLGLGVFLPIGCA